MKIFIQNSKYEYSECVKKEIALNEEVFIIELQKWKGNIAN